MRIKQYIIALIVIITTIQKVCGTAQIPDYLIYNGDTLSIYANPLESYFENHPRPDDIFDKYGYNSTACWRGYIGFWELKNDSLFLVELEGDSLSIDLSLIFTDREIGNKVFADWFDHSILNPYGKRIHYVHMGYESIYEYEREFVFSKGVLTKIKEYDNSKSKISNYTHDSQLLTDFIKTNMNNFLLPDSIEKARVFVQIDKVNIDGKIDSVSIIRGFNETLDNEAMRIVKLIPEWDVLYQRGERYNIPWIVPIIFKQND